MQTIFRGKHFITLEEWSLEEIDTLLDVSYELKRDFAMDRPTDYLPRKTVFLMFFEQSTRTRNSMKPASHSWAGMPTSSTPVTCRLPTVRSPRIRRLSSRGWGTR